MTEPVIRPANLDLSIYCGHCQQKRDVCECEHGPDGWCECCCRKHGLPLYDGEYGLKASNCPECDPEGPTFDEALAFRCEQIERQEAARRLK